MATPLRPSSKTDEIVDNVRSAILAHRLLPGTHLREVSLGKLYGVSRTVVRQALQQLAKDGLVALAPGKIAAVAKPSPKEAHEIFDLRLAVERHTLTTLVAQARKPALAKLRAHLKEERRALAAGDIEAVRKLGAGFHVLMARVAGNDLLADLLEHLVARIALILALYQHDYDRHTECLQDEHQQLIDFIEAGTLAPALKLLQSHLGVVETSLRLDSTGQDHDLALHKALVAAP